MSELEKKFVNVKDWLRMHGDYNVVLYLNGLYGTTEIHLVHVGTTVFSDRGMHLEKRLDKVIDFLDKNFSDFTIYNLEDIND